MVKLFSNRNCAAYTSDFPFAGLVHAEAGRFTGIDHTPWHIENPDNSLALRTAMREYLNITDRMRTRVPMSPPEYGVKLRQRT